MVSSSKQVQEDLGSVEGKECGQAKYAFKRVTRGAEKQSEKRGKGLKIDLTGKRTRIIPSVQPPTASPVF